MVVDDMKYMYLLSSAKNTNYNVSEMHLERKRYIRVEFVKTVESSRQSRFEPQPTEFTEPLAPHRTLSAVWNRLVRLQKWLVARTGSCRSEEFTVFTNSNRFVNSKFSCGK